uniref:Potassium channel domain-containing protein n=1 Tax=Hemiselmis tepida TaxID=464990 RepID=A0A7S0WHU2_9CRYP
MLNEMDASSLYTLKKTDWRKNRDVVDMKQINVHRVAAVCGMLGLGCAILQNEMIITGAMPDDPLLTMLKIGNSVFSLMVVALLYYYYWLHTLFERIVNHLRRGAVLDTRIPAREILSKRLFWIEAAVCGFHIPPYVTFEIGIVQMSNFSLMRVETFGAVINCLRLYLVARCFTDWILARMPKRHTVATYAAVDLGTSYAFKQLFNGWGGVYYVMVSWTILLGLFGYWFRAAEMTACFFPSTVDDRCVEASAIQWTVDGVNYFEKENDLYMQNAIWAMLVTSTTVGYGDILANTHFSRAVAGGMGLLGIVLASLLTAALSSALQFNMHEMSALLILQREQARRELFLKAVLIVQYWWRVRKKKRLTSRQRKMDMFDLGLKFRHKKRETQVEVEDLAADNSKIDGIALRTKYLETAVEAIADKLWENEMIKDLSEQHHENARRELSVKSPHALLEPYRPPSPSKLKKLVPQSSFSRKVVARVAAHFADAVDKDRGMTHDELDGDREAEGLERQGTMRGFDGKEPFKFKKGWEWRKKRDIIDRKRRRNGLLSSLFGLLGTAASLVENELLIRNEPAESDVMNILKSINSGCSVMCAICVFNIYWLNILFSRVQAHLRRGQALDPDIPLSPIFKDPTYWIETLLCLCHNPPYFTFEFDITNLDNTIVYRSETLLCILNTLRCYLLWRVLTDQILDTLPRRHTVAMFASVKLGKEFAFKLMLNGWGAIWYIAGAWCFFVVLLGYWFRMFEISACGPEFAQTGNPACLEQSAITWTVAGVGTFPQTNNIYLWNAVWGIFVTTTTVGYGDIFPTTHLSRVVAVLAAFVGIVCASLLTASLGSSMQPSAQEMSATLVLHREKARHELLILAQRLIAFWWRRRQGTMTRRQRRLDPFELKMAFKRTLLDTNVEVEDCAGISKKIEQIVHRTKYLQRALDAIADKLWEPEVAEMQRKHQRRHRTTILGGGLMLNHEDEGHAHDEKDAGPNVANMQSMVLNRRNSFIQEARTRMMSRTSAVFSASIHKSMFQSMKSPMAGDPGYQRDIPSMPSSMDGSQNSADREAALQKAFARNHGGGMGMI